VLVTAVVLLAVAVLAPLAPHVLHRARLVYWQNRALAYAPPPGHVVYDDAAETERRPAAWDRLRPLMFTTPSRAVATPFVGAMRSANGPPRLVAIELFDRFANTQVRLGGNVIARGTLVQPPPTVDFARGVTIAHARPERLRVWAGRVDPADPSHVTIEFEADGRLGWVDGWLNGDDELVLSVRDAPATAAAVDMTNAAQAPPAAPR
jgi:hypothetical protein